MFTKRLDQAARFVADDRRAIPLLLVTAVVVRLAWAAVKSQFRPYPSELWHVAMTYAKTGVIADAYGFGSGPTAHVGPIAHLPAALVYRLLGGASLASEIVLTILAALVVAATGLLGNATLRRLGTPVWARALGLLTVLFLPIFFELEAWDLRVRETALSALGLMWVIWFAVRLDQAGKVRWAHIVGLAAVAAVLFLLSPSAALGAYAACGLLGLRRIPWQRWPATAVIAISMVAAMSVPWAMRNERVFGEMVWSRSNFGLEYAIGTNPEAIAPADPAKNFQQTLKTYHPFASKEAYAKMQAAGGELKYAQSLEAKTKAWVAGHRVEAAILWLRHLYEFYFPPIWLWTPYATPTTGSIARAILVSGLTAAAAGSLLLQLWQRRWQALYFALPIIAVALPYAICQPRTRYRYVIATLITLLAFDALGRLAALVTRRREPT